MTPRASVSGNDSKRESVESFVPTPEIVSQYLERNVKEVSVEMESVEGREKLYRALLEHEEELRQKDPSFQPESLRRQLDLVGKTLMQKKIFLEQAESPQAKGMLRRTWETVKGFPRKHPVLTALLLVAAAGGVAGYLGYLPFDQWWAKLKNLLQMKGWGVGSGGGAGTAGGAGEAVEAAKEAVKDLSPSLRTFGHQIEYGGKIYDLKDIPSLVQKLPDLKPGEAIKILRGADSRAAMEVELRRFLLEKYQDPLKIDWMGHEP